MNHLSNQFFKQFLKRIQSDSGIPSDFKEKIASLCSNEKISKGNHLRDLLNNFDSQQKAKNENSKN